MARGRPRLPLGTCGKIRTEPVDKDDPKKGFRARAKVRDYDGRTRLLKRNASSRAAARALVAQAVRDRHRSRTADITPDTRVDVVAEAWWEGIQESGKSVETLRNYRGQLDRYILPALGALRMRELTVGTADAHIQSVREAKGGATARSCKAVLSAICGFAARKDAAERNVVRDTERIVVTRVKELRALTREEADDLRTKVAANKWAVDHVLPDLLDMFWVTGNRIAETCAIQWTDLDLTNPKHATLKIGDKTVADIKGKKGMSLYYHDSSKLNLRTLELPEWYTRRLIELKAASTTPHVFPSPKGMLRNPSNTTRDIGKVMDEIGYPWVTPHTFRHTMSTWMEAAGLSLRQAADQLGHRSMVVAQSYVVRKFSSTGAKGLMEDAMTRDDATIIDFPATS